MMPKIWCTC